MTAKEKFCQIYETARTEWNEMGQAEKMMYGSEDDYIEFVGEREGVNIADLIMTGETEIII